MTKTLAILAFAATTLMAGTALADDDDCYVPMADWQPRAEVAKLAEENGWTVRRIKIDDGCYEIRGQDAEGRRIEVKVHPATLAVLEVEYEDDDHPLYERDRTHRSDD
ncbi:PepSY domain-containing protein [Salipiger sp. P9]|uniref:PepSY domain-containing protein n=1 Tax=Salipiger pentaromativorans TaxID=2943193 RepID=UPI00215832E4|nr:PepSY domain-containing protein [Salipiger pentaromativorans]MCR8548910.1 PepSY domain-containing protein [Salipiger pentaromativorans]